MDEDEDENAQVTYSIKSGADGVFDIEEQTGVIRLRSLLNSARKAQYKLKVAAKDRGDRKAVEDAVVEILVENSPSNYLDFGSSSYHFVVVEDPGKKEPAIGREVGRLSVNNKQVQSSPKYSIIGSCNF